MKRFYYAINEDLSEDPAFTKYAPQDGKKLLFASVVSAGETDNLLSVFQRNKNIVSVNACQTKKAAEELAAFWNECYKQNGTYAFRRAGA